MAKALAFHLDDYKADNPLCEVAPYLPWPLLSLAFNGRPRRTAWADVTHHIGYGGHGQRDDELWNVIRVCQPVHDLFHGMHCPKPVNQVLCAWVKRFGKKRLGKTLNEMDWAAMGAMTREQWPGKFCTDNHARLCGQWPEIEAMRLELLTEAA